MARHRWPPLDKVGLARWYDCVIKMVTIEKTLNRIKHIRTGWTSEMANRYYLLDEDMKYHMTEYNDQSIADCLGWGINEFQ